MLVVQAVSSTQLIIRCKCQSVLLQHPVLLQGKLYYKFQAVLQIAEVSQTTLILHQIVCYTDDGDCNTICLANCTTVLQTISQLDHKLDYNLQAVSHAVSQTVSQAVKLLCMWKKTDAKWQESARKT